MNRYTRLARGQAPERVFTKSELVNLFERSDVQVYTRRQEFLGPEDFLDYLIDPDAWMSIHYNVTLDHVRRWREFTRDETTCYCTGTTKRGRRCKVWLGDSHHVGCGRFVFGVDDRCPRHQEPKGGVDHV